MKRIAKYFVAAVGMVAAVACNKEAAQVETPQQNGKGYTFTATIGAETKTVLDGMTAKWMGDADGNEYIHVMDGNGGHDTYVASGITSPVTEAEFTFTGTEPTVTANSVVAIYPSIYGDDWVPTCLMSQGGRHVVKAFYKTQQAAVEGSFDPQGPVMMAYNDDVANNSSLSFKNMSALLKFSLDEDSDPVDNVTLFVPGDGRLAGLITIDEKNGEYTFVGNESEDNWVELSGNIEPGKTYYIAVAPGTFDGITFQMNKDENNQVSINHEVTFERNRIYDLGNSFSYTETDLDLGLCGAFTEWGDQPDVEMELLGGGLYVAYGVELEGAFKIRRNGEWKDENDNPQNYGLKTVGSVESGYFYYLTDDGQNITVDAGTYDIYYNVKTYQLYVMSEGESIDGVSEGQVAPLKADNWYIVGTFNMSGTAWVLADPDYKMTFDGEWYVFKNFDTTGDEVKFNDGSWDVNRGGTFSSKDAAISVGQDWGNIAVPAGTYDVYLSSDADYAFFMTPGKKPTPVVEDTNGPSKVGLSGSFNGWGYTLATKSGNAYKISGVTLSNSDTFKVRVNDDWLGWGAATIEGISTSDDGSNDHNYKYNDQAATYNVSITLDWNASAKTYSNVKAVFSK